MGETMTAKTALGYMDYAKVLSSKMKSQATIAPVGRAMQWAKGQHGSVFKRLFQGDASQHPTQDGAYLVACVFFASIWNKSPEGLSYAPPGVKDKSTLQSIAAHAVVDHGLPLTTARYDHEIDGRVSWSDSFTARALQAMLNAQGYTCHADGILGKETIQRLKEFLAVVADDRGSAGAASGSLDRPTVEGLQRYLTNQSFAPANGIDGQFDSTTIKALQKFLAGLPEQR